MRTVSNNKQLFNTHTKPPYTKIILTITTKKKKITLTITSPYDTFLETT